MENRDLIVLGGGIAGVSALRAALESDSRASVLLLNGEDRTPYKRTKISKYLAEGSSGDRFALIGEEDRNLHASIVNSRVRSLDTGTRTVTTEEGREIAYGSLVIATGALPRRFPGPVFVFRSVLDGEEIRKRASVSRSAAIIGAGVLGVETAEQLSRMGLRVTLFGSAGRVMDRELDAAASELMARLLTENGVTVACGERIMSAHGVPGGAALVSASGKEYTFDMAVSCVGTDPDVRVARGAGIETDRGIVVDRFLRTSAEKVFAAGDAVRLPSGSVPHLWHAAELQGGYAGRNALGGRIEYPDPPFRLKCEVYGRYFFSMGLDREDERTDVLSHAGPPYRRFGFTGGRLISVIMADDGVRAKEYEAAVRDGATRDQVTAVFLTR